MEKTIQLTSPADEWKQGFPVGTGRLAAMVLGTHDPERIALNHEWLWTGQTRDRDNIPCADRLDEIRALLMNGEYEKGTNLANHVYSPWGGTLYETTPNRIDNYQPAGDLLVHLAHGPVTNYSRALDLDGGLVTISYVSSGVRYRREIYADFVHDLILVRLVAEAPFNATFRLARVEDKRCTVRSAATPGSLSLEGAFSGGMAFRICAGLLLRGGAATVDGDAIAVRDTEEALVWLNIGTSAKGDQPRNESDRGLPGDWNWDVALAAHRIAFAEAYDGMTLSCDVPANEQPTDKRLAALRAGTADPGLAVLFFNFGRYLLLTATARAELPPNLQGKWNEDLKPPWNCCYVYDVNLQMAYWPAEPTALPQTTGPLFQFLESHVPHARAAARNLFDCDGVWFCMMSDAWARSTPESHGWAVWTGSAAWLAQHFWWHYEFGLDEAFLSERAYPFFKEIAAFYESFLIEDDNGVLQSVPSQSPENHFEGGGDLPSTLCASATVDLVLIRQVLGYAVESARILGLDADNRALWQSMLERLPPFQVGRHGQLQEWLEDVEESEPGHRHFSHLLGLYPGDLMGPERTPELWEAGKRSVARRMAHDGGHSGWSRAWSACFYARFGDGARAWEHAVHCLTTYATDSLLDLHPPLLFQIDGNYGFAAAVVEMLLQSYHRELDFLPALPPVWPSGSVHGMRARGGWTVDMTWRDSALTEATVTALQHTPCTILHMADTATVEDAEGSPVPVTRDGHRLTFQAEPGRAYRVIP